MTVPRMFIHSSPPALASEVPCFIPLSGHQGCVKVTDLRPVASPELLPCCSCFTPVPTVWAPDIAGASLLLIHSPSFPHSLCCSYQAGGQEPNTKLKYAATSSCCHCSDYCKAELLYSSRPHRMIFEFYQHITWVKMCTGYPLGWGL